MPVDLSPYLQNVLDPADVPLLEEAAKAAQADVPRGAYILVWLACAESLKRRFREAQKRDGAAGKVVGDIAKKESDQKAVDRFVLDEAEKYGFIDGTAHAELLNVYQMRCVYGHPYEKAPLPEQLVDAAAVVTSNVLSQPIKLKQGYANGVLDDLFNDPHYLDDTRTAVADFAKSFCGRVAEEIHGWLIQECLKRLEGAFGDGSRRLFISRGEELSRTVIREAGCGVVSEDQWHSFVKACPLASCSVLTSPAIFPDIGKLAQDYLISSAFEQAARTPSCMRTLERLLDSGKLSSRQVERFQKHIHDSLRTHAGRVMDRVFSTGAEWLRGTGLRLRTAYGELIEAFKSHCWYTQNPVAELVQSQGPDGVSELSPGQQEELGRNILQSAEGSATSSASLLELVGKAEEGQWPIAFIRGIVLECFVNEEALVRFKTSGIGLAMACLWSLSVEDQKDILAVLVEVLRTGKPKRGYLTQQEVDLVLAGVPEEERDGRASLAELRKALSDLDLGQDSDAPPLRL